MLDIQRADDVDAGVENLQHVLIALFVPRAGHVGVGQFVDDDHFRLACQDGVEIHLFDVQTAIGNFSRGTTSSPSSKADVSTRPWVSTNPTTTSTPAFLQGVGLFQHAIGLADARGKAQIELQPAALAAVDQFQKILGSRPGRFRRSRIAHAHTHRGNADGLFHPTAPPANSIKHLSDNCRGLSQFAQSAEQNGTVPFSEAVFG